MRKEYPVKFVKGVPYCNARDSVSGCVSDAYCYWRGKPKNCCIPCMIDLLTTCEHEEVVVTQTGITREVEEIAYRMTVMCSDCGYYLSPREVRERLNNAIS